MPVPVFPVPEDTTPIVPEDITGMVPGSGQTTEATGIFKNLTTLQSSIADGVPQAQPIKAALQKVLGFIPDGELKSWIGLSDPVSFFKKVNRALFGGKYQSGQYRLGEAYMYHIQLIDIHNRNLVPDEIVPVAQSMFTILFGVRVTNMEDLDALDISVEAYMKRPDKKDIPLQAIQRAVMLKQSFFPESLKEWPIEKFEQYPLVAPIPGVQPGTLYTGDLPGGGKATNGLIVVPDELLRTSNGSGSSGSVWLWVLLAVAIIGGVLLYANKNKQGFFK